MGWLLVPIYMTIAFISGLVTGALSQILTYTALGLGLVSLLLLVTLHIDNKFLDAGAAALSNEADAFTADEVRRTFSIVPMLIVSNIGFSICYNPMNAAMPNQACYMNTFIGGKQVNGNFYGAADAITIILLTPVFEYCVFPLWQRLQSGKHIKLGHKLIAGMIAVFAANAAAAWIEIQRRQSPVMTDRDGSNCATVNGVPVKMSAMGSTWMCLPMSLLGIGEIFFNPALYHFVYTTMPIKVRSTVMAFYLLAFGGMSNAFTSALSVPLTPPDFNTGHLEYFYYVNMVICALSIVFYVVVRRAMRRVSNKTDTVGSSFVEHAENVRAPLHLSIHDRAFSALVRTSTRQL